MIIITCHNIYYQKVENGHTDFIAMIREFIRFKLKIYLDLFAYLVISASHPPTAFKPETFLPINFKNEK